MRWLRRSTKTATGAAIATAAMALAAGSVLPEARASAASPTVTPATWGAPTVVRASVGVRGWTVAISASGRYLAYGDVRYDRWSGTATPLERGLGGARPNGLVGAVALARDGQLAFFVSSSSNLVAGDVNGVADLFLRRFDTNTIELVSRATGTGGRPGAWANMASLDVDATEDGHYVVFTSRAGNLVAGDTNNVRDVFVRDRWAGTTSRASTGSDGRQLTVSSVAPEISADGRFVSMVSGGRGYVKDRVTGARTLVTIDRSGAPVSPVQLQDRGGLSMSANGRLVAYQKVVPENGGFRTVMVRDRVAARTDVLDTRGIGDDGAISDDGRFVAWVRWCLPPETCGPAHVGFDLAIRDRSTSTTFPVVGAHSVFDLAFSAGGRHIAYWSYGVDGDEATRGVFVSTRRS